MTREQRFQRYDSSYPRFLSPPPGGPTRLIKAGGSPWQSPGRTSRSPASVGKSSGNLSNSRDDGEFVGKRHSLRPFKEVVYKRDAPRPAPLANAPSLVQAALCEGQDKDMIYVQCEVGDGGTAVEMLVDTGAQMSVISLPLVRKLKLMDRVDWRQRGIASGVGHATILGCLQSIPVRLGSTSGVEFALDFSVLDVEQDLLMLGIDQLRRFECIIDLQRQCLVFGGHGGSEVSFLPPESHGVHWRHLCPVM